MALSTLVNHHGLATHEIVRAEKDGTSLRVRYDGKLAIAAPTPERDALLLALLNVRKISGDGMRRVVAT